MYIPDIRRQEETVMFHCIFVSRLSRRGGRGTWNGGFAEGKGNIGFVLISFHTVQAENRQPDGLTGGAGMSLMIFPSRITWQRGPCMLHETG